MSATLPHFNTLATIDGTYEVVDENGRAVDRRDSRASASGVANTLNSVVRAGGDAALSKWLSREPVESVFVVRDYS